MPYDGRMIDTHESTAPNRPDHRQRITTLLGLLTSERAQQVLARRLGREQVAYALAQAWFDDVYVPGKRYLDSLKGDLQPEAVESFHGAFDPFERAAMERFHRFFELRIDMLPEDRLASRRIPIDDRWTSLMKDAGYLLEDLGVVPRHFVRRLEEARDIENPDDLQVDLFLDDRTHTGA